MCQPAAPLVDHVAEVMTILTHGDSMMDVRNLGKEEGGFMRAYREMNELEVCCVLHMMLIIATLTLSALKVCDLHCFRRLLWHKG